jgi:hypothetical protein
LVWISLWLKNRCLQHPCFKNLCKIAQASKNSNSNAQHFLSDLLTHSWFHSMLFALPSYQFPYIVMNRCLYVTCKLGCLNGHLFKSRSKLGPHHMRQEVVKPVLTYFGLQPSIAVFFPYKVIIQYGFNAFFHPSRPRNSDYES